MDATDEQKLYCMVKDAKRTAYTTLAITLILAATLLFCTIKWNQMVNRIDIKVSDNRELLYDVRHIIYKLGEPIDTTKYEAGTEIETKTSKKYETK